MTDLGFPAWNDAVKEVVDTREKLEKASKNKKKKKKKKGKGKKSSLLRSSTSNKDDQSEYDDGVTSAWASSNKDSADAEFAEILVDYAFVTTS